MICETKKVGNVNIFVFAGDVVFSNLKDLREIVKREVGNATSNKFLLDLTRVGMIDSAGVGFIVSVYKTVLSSNGSFALINPSEAVENVLQTVGLTRILKVYESEDEALKAV